MAYRAHREWTERAIRELVRKEMKGLRPGKSYAINGAQMNTPRFILSDDISATEPYDNIIMKEMNVGDYIATKPLDSGVEGITTYYNLVHNPQSPTVERNGKKIFSIYMLGGFNSYYNQAALMPPSIKPIISDITITPPRRAYTTASGDGKYWDLFALQDNKVYPLMADGLDSISGVENGVNYRQYFYTYSPVLTYEDFFSPFNPSITEEEYNAIFTGKWSEYDWTRTEHIMCINFSYKKG